MFNLGDSTEYTLNKISTLYDKGKEIRKKEEFRNK
jgi:hypothetical protein